jgi:hypothetical protein
MIFPGSLEGPSSRITGGNAPQGWPSTRLSRQQSGARGLGGDDLATALQNQTTGPAPSPAAGSTTGKRNLLR